MNPTASSDCGLAGWLLNQQVSLVMSTYRANRLLFVGVSADGRLAIQERRFDRPMGLFASEQTLWMAGRSHLWRFDNLLTPGQMHDGADRLYVPAASFLIGEVNTHELIVDQNDAPLFVNTVFSCLAQLDTGCCQADLDAPFIDALALNAGLPLLTGAGTTFTARMGASLCNAANLQELVMDDLNSYHQCAVALGRDPARLQQIKHKLNNNANGLPLFQQGRWANDLCHCIRSGGQQGQC